MEIKNDTSFLDDGLSSKEILKEVQKIRDYITMKKSLSYEEKIENLKESSKFFCNRYPMLFDMCTKDDFSYDNLNFFLKMRDKIIENKISNEDASKEIGKIWFDKYVDLSKSKTK